MSGPTPRHARPTMVRWRAALVALTLAAGLALTGLASADPDFGPGNGTQSGPQAPNAKCHPPGQTVTEPGCK